MSQAISLNLHMPGALVVGGGNGFTQALRLVRPDAEELREQEAMHKKLWRILKARRARAEFFGGDLFADPAWDILLELYASDLAHKRMSVSDVCIASNVPATTALRWIRTLEYRGLLQRREDPFDGRRFFVQLSDAGASAVKAFFQNAPSADHVL